MIKQVLLFALISIVVHKLYRYYTFMGYSRRGLVIEEHEPLTCTRKYEHLVASDDKQPLKTLPIPNTLDSDILPNGICVFSSGQHYPSMTLNENYTYSSVLKVRQQSESSLLFMLDMNYLNQLNPVVIKIVDSVTKQPHHNHFNLFAISIYQDNESNFKLVAANFNTTTRSITLEHFAFDTTNIFLVHLNSNFKNSDVDFNNICDLVVVEDYLIYFTKCFSNGYNRAYKFPLESKSGEIWLINLKENVIYLVASHLFFPKSIAYLSKYEMIVVTNLAWNGVSFYKKEANHGLTKLHSIELDSFVFSMNVDLDGALWLTLHPILYETMGFFKEDAQSTSNVASKLIKMKLEFKNKGKVLVNYDIEEVFATNGTLFNALGSSVVFEDNLILFSFVSDPKICSIRN